jgi:YVTN family beta-propeller protein
VNIFTSSITFIILSLGLVFFLLSSCEINAVTVHDKTLEKILNDTDDIDKYYHIDVGDKPTSIQILYDAYSTKEKVYVTNSDSDSISVIDGNNDVVIGDIIENISNPRGMASDNPQKIFVTNSRSPNGTVSVIDAKTDKIIEKILVGEKPWGIETNNDESILYVTNRGSNTISVIDASNYTIIKNIPVGENPVDIDVENGKLFIANYGNHSISVIDESNYKIIKNIPVGENPVDIDVENGKLFVANSGDGNVSVINTSSFTLIKNISINKGISAIDIVNDLDKIYVADKQSNHIRVINGSNYNVIANITVGKDPSNIAINQRTDKVYIANEGSDSVSIIDPNQDKLIGGFTFNIHPPNSGFIQCNNFNSSLPLSQHFYMTSEMNCVAKPNKGFDFVSWEENLSKNGTLLKKNPALTPITVFDYIAYYVSAFTKFFGMDFHFKTVIDYLDKNYNWNVQSKLNDASKFFGIRAPEDDATLQVTKAGTYTATFKEVSSPLPPGYWETIFSIIITALIGSWLTPSILDWLKMRRQWKKLKSLEKKMEKIKKISKADRKFKLDKLNDEIRSTYVQNKITKDQFDKLKDDFSKIDES